MSLVDRRLSTKLVIIAVAFLMVALMATGLTLLESWKFEGGAAAVNDMGSQRMRSYRMAYLLTESLRDRQNAAVLRGELAGEMQTFDRVLAGLRRGDPARPMFLPRRQEIANEVDAVSLQWRHEVRPLIESVLAEAHAASAHQQAGGLRARLDGFVGRIDALVRAIEQDNAREVATLRYVQFAMVALAVLGTVALIYLMFLLVVRPLGVLQGGIQRMTAGEFATRLPVESRDEFGELAAGFNRMAERLQDLYANLEHRVTEKTADLEGKNRNLVALYGVARLLNEPLSIEKLSRGFLTNLIRLFGAEGGAVRLVDPKTGQMIMYVQEGLAPAFVRDEQCLEMGECLCGEAALRGETAVEYLGPVRAPNAMYQCQKAGYRTVSMSGIRFKGRVLGIFNLYFRERRALTAGDRQVLEALGQQLGAAIESQRLLSRDKELAVSEERNLLAQELHDSIAQSLAFLNIQAQMLEDSLRRDAADEARAALAQIREGVQQSYDDVRELLVHFRTRVTQEEDMGAGLRALLERFEGQTGIKTAFRESGTGVPLPAEKQLQVLHILQEALSNVRKHAGAAGVTLEMQRGPVYRFRVRDDGCGFDPRHADDGSGTHVGLSIMRERAHRIGGEFKVASRPGEGAEVMLALPVAQRVAA